jgi:hypothetical protein
MAAHHAAAGDGRCFAFADEEVEDGLAVFPDEAVCLLRSGDRHLKDERGKRRGKRGKGGAGSRGEEERERGKEREREEGGGGRDMYQYLM